ncbi:MAG: DEAD/DEAH box helicase [Microvirga sp.]
MSNFSHFGLAPLIEKALAAEGYETPTPIQIQAIPHVMAGRDLCGIAQTGTGKTAAFALPILHHFAEHVRQTPRRGCRALVLSPTRELASQIADSFRAYGRHLRLSTAVVFGGVPIGKQERTLAGGVDILVATPGRLLDLIDRRSLSLRDVEVFVLDEADRMLDLGFIHDLRRIVKLLPAERQTLFFSATMPATIASLAAAFLNDPVQVAVRPEATTAERVEQSIMFVPTAQKPALLHAVLSDPAVERVLVFTRTKHGADKVVRSLAAGGIAAAAIHGNKSQPQRERALAGFKSGHCRVLVATDIAARGIDVDGVTHVVNYDLPNIPESYVHRIGRTARAGAAGIAISFCNGEEREYLRDIEKVTRMKVPVAELPKGIAALPAEPARAEPSHHRPGRPQQQRQGQRPAQGQGRGGQGRSAQGQGNGNSRNQGNGQGRGQGRGNGHGNGSGRAPERQQEAGRQRPAHEPRRSRPADGHVRPAGQGDGGAIGWLSHGASRPR